MKKLTKFESLEKVVENLRFLWLNVKNAELRLKIQECGVLLKKSYNIK